MMRSRTGVTQPLLALRTHSGALSWLRANRLACILNRLDVNWITTIITQLHYSLVQDDQQAPTSVVSIYTESLVRETHPLLACCTVRPRCCSADRASSSSVGAHHVPRWMRCAVLARPLIMSPGRCGVLASPSGPCGTWGTSCWP